MTLSADVGTGDVITPEAVKYSYPLAFDDAANRAFVPNRDAQTPY